MPLTFSRKVFADRQRDERMERRITGKTIFRRSFVARTYKKEHRINANQEKKKRRKTKTRFVCEQQMFRRWPHFLKNVHEIFDLDLSTIRCESMRYALIPNMNLVTKLSNSKCKK